MLSTKVTFGAMLHVCLATTSMIFTKINLLKCTYIFYQVTDSVEVATFELPTSRLHKSQCRPILNIIVEISFKNVLLRKLEESAKFAVIANVECTIQNSSFRVVDWHITHNASQF